MIKFEIKNRETGKKEAYEKEDISLIEAEKFYELQEKQKQESEKARKKAIAIVEKEYGTDFDNTEFYIQLVQQNFNQVVDAKKIRQLEREYFVSLFADQGLTEKDILENMSTKLYNKISEDIFREISGEDEEDNEDESEEVGKSEEQ
ncbi:hypothetical protein ACFP67_10890 [Mammaliicoccus sciuri]|uniref:hypothetical protein n=1 Tax=Mammaliicoccus TaxID=2803850 RepID=UPI000CD09508|nr:MULTISPECIES: hypothetical protein [Mammaliicoccus]MBF9298227.1 hypothetical protein [Staphylococcus schleiferi]PNZ25258.1 hypothetical protein CD114_10995 [Mammaliicoccus sciuri]QYG31586.1 hypothetical protein K0O13_01385 [Mammaliicoccus sciuri]RXY85243.1 hypothetical protein DD607_32755 [Salmonella sp. 3DZ2-4SM]